MSVFEYKTNKGTFQFESNRAMSDAELGQAIERQELQNMSIGDILSKNFVEALQHVHSEGLSPIGSAIDAFAFGVPRAMLKTFNPALDKKIFPEQTTLQGKTLRAVGTARALLTGGAAKLSSAVAGKLVPKVAKETLGRSVSRGAVQGAVAGGSQMAGDPADSILEQIGRQGLQASLGGGVGAVAPIAGLATGKVVSGGKKIAKSVVENVRNWKKGAEGYITDVVAPKMSATIKSHISQMDPRVVNYVERTLNISRESLARISKIGADALDEVYAQTRGLTSDIENRLRIGLAQRRDIADQAYDMAMNVVPDKHTFLVNNTRATIKANLMKKGLINDAGIATERVKIATPADKALIDVYDELQRMPSANKTDFTFLRDKLGSLYKDQSTSNADVYKAVSALYDDAADSGFKGLQEARALQRRAFDMEREFTRRSGLLNEKKLNTYDRWSAEEQRTLSKLTSYIEDEFPIDAGILDDLQNINASRELQVLKQKIAPDVIAADLRQSTNKELFNSIRGKWRDVIGEKEADAIFSEVSQATNAMAFRKALPGQLTVAGGTLGAVLGTRKLMGFGAYRLGSDGVRTLSED